MIFGVCSAIDVLLNVRRGAGSSTHANTNILGANIIAAKPDSPGIKTGSLIWAGWPTKFAVLGRYGPVPRLTFQRLAQAHDHSHVGGGMADLTDIHLLAWLRRLDGSMPHSGDDEGLQEWQAEWACTKHAGGIHLHE